MRIDFKVFVNDNVTKDTHIFWGLYKDALLNSSNFTLFFTAKTLYEIQDYKRKKSLSYVKQHYNKFANMVENIPHVVVEKLVFGRGGTNRIVLNYEGIKKFIHAYAGKIAICPKNLHSLMRETVVQLKRNNAVFIEDMIEPVKLQKYLESQSNSLVDNAVYALLHSCNVCYVIELQDGYFYVGHTLALFKDRLKNHNAFNVKTFKQMYSAFIFNETAKIDSSILENCIHKAAADVLGVNKIDVEKTIGGYGFRCEDYQMREIIETALLNPNVSFHLCATRASNLALSNIKPNSF